MSLLKILVRWEASTVHLLSIKIIITQLPHLGVWPLVFFGQLLVGSSYIALA